MLRAFIASQFKKPTGLFGIFSSSVMIKNNRKNYDRLIMDLDLQPQDKLLEIGYGPGVGIRMIAEQCSTCTIHGIDFSGLMYKKAARYNRQYIEEGRVQLQYGDFLKFTVVPNEYDKIFCLNVVYFWNELKLPFNKVFSLLKRGGSFHIYMADAATLEEKKAPDSVFNKHTIEQVVTTLKEAGFEKVEHYPQGGFYIKATK
ncbi:MAG: class I SAM-dependent methyltransferase [Candidatus Dadabacteria bacterium]